MGYDVESDVRIGDPVSQLHFRLDVRALLLDELGEFHRGLGDVAPPVVAELKAGEMPIAVVDGTGKTQVLVAVPSGAKGPEDVKIGQDLHRNAGYAHLDPVENAIGPDAIDRFCERGSLVHRQRHQAGSLRCTGFGVLPGERSPDRLPGAVIHQPGSEDARDDDDRIPIATVVLRRAVVDLAKVRALELRPRAASQSK